jgi:hypothetical protein
VVTFLGQCGDPSFSGTSPTAIWTA